MLNLFQPSTFDVAQVFAAVDCFRSLKIVYSQLQVFLIVLTRCYLGIFTKHCKHYHEVTTENVSDIANFWHYLCYDHID